MANFDKLFQNFMIIGLVLVSFLSFGVTLQSDNNVNNPFVDDPLIGETYTDLRENLGDLRDSSQSQKTLFETENPTQGFGTFLLYSILSAGKVFNSMVVGLFNIMIKLPVVVIGLDPIVVGILTAMLIFIIIIGLWIIYKVGG